MGDPKATSLSLPPGCRFYPSDEQLLCYYLSGKNSNPHSGHGTPDGFDLITELELYGYDPFELPDRACYSYGYGGRKTHWFCYTVRVVKESRGRRRAKSGYWRRRGRAREVVGLGGKAVLGTKTSFIFYLGNSPKTAVRTDWVLYEYALIDHPKASLVLCRVFVKSHGRNSISENGLNSCAEESASAVRHIGIQTPEINSFGRVNDISRHPVRLDSELDAQIMTEPVSVSSSQFPSDIQPKEQVTSSSLVSLNALEAEHLLSILKDDFIELDDLVD